LVLQATLFDSFFATKLKHPRSGRHPIMMRCGPSFQIRIPKELGTNTTGKTIPSRYERNRASSRFLFFCVLLQKQPPLTECKLILAPCCFAKAWRNQTTCMILQEENGAKMSS